MMELQLKHLACYLPYEMKFLGANLGKEYIDTLVRISAEESNLVDGKRYGTYLFDIKPLLYPLSSLTEPIKHNGEEFIMANVLSTYYRHAETEIDAKRIADDLILTIKTKSISAAGMELLHKAMFDTDELIDAGLAIDVTTLDKNPYE